MLVDQEIPRRIAGNDFQLCESCHLRLELEDRSNSYQFSDTYLDKIGDRIASFLKTIRQIYTRISCGDEQFQTFYLPKALVDAFNPMIIYVCICSQISHEFTPEWTSLQRRARRILKCLRTAEYQLISMIHAGDFSEAKMFRRVNAQDIVTMVTGRLARIPNGDPNEIPSQDGFNLLQIYRQYISGLVRMQTVRY